MGIKEMLEKAVQMGSVAKFQVQVNAEEIREVSYIELGTFLVTNVPNIERIYIKMRD